ncbi:DUF368 domain-containing protein [Cellulosilyticum ruminicola]|uniref:DUF368 domain-containing protein n=1 Tax=Cellulosilyticum ruminicola TaxID=425254 RepID=UPI002E8E4D94|nr:DUF368 domain-containing protein [Cellulosilyticum ruminicola]
MLLIFVGGFLMALADSVPGVSGGTIAFLMGFYDNFINSLSTIFSRSRNAKLKALKFLVNLGLGWIIGFVAAVFVLNAVFETYIYEVSSLFIGFIVCSTPIILREEWQVLKGKYLNLICTIIGVVIVVVITYLNTQFTGNSGINLNNLSIPLIIYVFVVGMIAISAMILPGISGSTLILIFGLYIPIMSAVKEVLTLNFRFLPILIIFSIGVVTGIVVVIKGVKAALRHYRPQTIYTILGLMLGSLYSICIGPTTMEGDYLPMSVANFSIIFFLIGGLIVLSLQGIKEYKNIKTK